ncbi:hypothetical protein KC614_01620 [candidate division WWE3 bacterium]|uniref:Peptidase M50 domain-containing protein n=1 Tax=candidate division WWE3 bacterium TaxID=2053526 RepID=A0A955RRW8_UNCKA|nr:hypothetical protein [candidate division WWE3 bacterium]
MRFSDVEITELMKAWFAISLAFTIVWRGLPLPLWAVYLIAAITVGVAFLLHEIAHKFVAQRFGCWAEFRGFDLGLILAVLMSFVGFIFAAPGAVVISGLVTRDENGKIAAAGPVTNLILASFFFVFNFALLAFLGDYLSLTVVGIASLICQVGFSINSWLAFFNLIPFGPLDGVKILNWSKRIWFVLIVLAGAMTFLIG